ncbi:DUF3307 domain-containing protein [Maritimibacter sp. UBA3975]|uniref:DUF3307 domain-containing protein n=1 Tax=Maritimibacter sp. UBA3975 TaxID=1946833 RepID=UPI000C0AEA19|nr:DUF3307 domain-containing protein [Maritimibacter sp. UBA3975]MAM62313.1 hypothetical protein [Maritimibacter sp.]|tara:strand:+ start:10307 stop:10687 length:381 start_codon:yes stop_codon:yes gene_type:complete
MTPERILLILLLLQLKHLLADYVWQNMWMISNKGRYGHPGGLAHAGLHALLTVIVLVVTGFDIGLVLILGLIEFVIHYHIDFAKDHVQRWRKPDHKKREYWVFHGIDQFFHQATLVGIIAALLWFA